MKELPKYSRDLQTDEWLGEDEEKSIAYHLVQWGHKIK